MRSRFFRTFFFPAVVSLFLLSCQTAVVKKAPTTFVNEPNLVNLSYMTAEGLLSSLNLSLDPNRPVLVASFVDIKNLEHSSNFGRVIADCISSHLTKKGYMVIELKLRNSLYIKKGAGEFLLSREIDQITQTHDAQAVVVGTYAVAHDAIYLSSRIVQAKTAQIISSFDCKIPMTKNYRMLIRDS